MATELKGMPDLTSMIQRSLERSAQYGIDPNHSGAPEANRLTSKQLRERIEDQQEFYSLAREQLDSLYRLLKDTGFCMALADRDGYILYVVGDSDLVEHFKRRRCTPGYRWTERDLGTCAIGLALEERKPIFLPGDMMYSAPAQKFSNAGAPVISPDGMEVLGVISLSGYTEKMHIHTLGLVRQSAETVTAHLRASDHTRELEIKNHYMKALLQSASRGMVTVDQRGCIVEVNHRAQVLLRISENAEGESLTNYLDESFEILKYLEVGKEFSVREILIRKTGATHFVSFDPIRIKSGELVGGLITVLAKKEIMRLAVEVGGSHAHFTFDSILGESKELKKALHLAHIAAGSATPVLLSGETGTGKELFAQAIHNESDRRNRPFVAINCGAIPKELLESELFGYEEGAFTGAQKGGRPGKFELADTGTLFLDEIGEMPFDMQVKLLRALQSGEIQRVGGLRSIQVDLRIISATNKDLKRAIQEYQFRSDLYYRICTLKIAIPPLRDRMDDILPLAEYFINRHELLLNRNPRQLKSETIEELLKYGWPGNIRQLESAVERAVHLSEGGVLMPEHFGLTDKSFTSSNNKRNSQQLCTLYEIERQAIVDTLEKHNNNICKAAVSLGISRPTIYRKLKKYGVEQN